MEKQEFRRGHSHEHLALGTNRKARLIDHRIWPKWQHLGGYHWEDLVEIPKPWPRRSTKGKIPSIWAEAVGHPPFHCVLGPPTTEGRGVLRCPSGVTVMAPKLNMRLPGNNPSNSIALAHGSNHPEGPIGRCTPTGDAAESPGAHLWWHSIAPCAQRRWSEPMVCNRSAFAAVAAGAGTGTPVGKDPLAERSAGDAGAVACAATLVAPSRGAHL